MGNVIGIDLGTTNSCVAFTSGSRPEVIANLEGSRTTPSTVAFTESGEKLVGQIAKRQAATNPSRTLFAIKRLIGRKHASKEVDAFQDVAPFSLLEAENGDVDGSREWLRRASMSEPDPAWVCGDCGNTVAEWEPICGQCEKFDALLWKAPARITRIDNNERSDHETQTLESVSHNSPKNKSSVSEN